ncbi:DNA internalization-related competence protein ComEC/Rec2 [Neobacillus cucumis]|uniref:DNA internalization-related competence protein ComEC/Rec2 n=1 Tax=Neobacillus cucumis TaxID=1740721 RepID=A0A2N5H6R8_9BACI|nr:DNA internalization-related competence protein ComEC/Rec2 [Neobacillus cucumis]PLS01215.1 DNA internalization-related competence protein ComEC/Rec2 [Neobacillus cucumis]
MSGKYIYVALAAFLGVLSAIVKLFPFLILLIIVIIYVFILLRMKKYKQDQILLIIFIGFLFFLKGEWAEAVNQSKMPDSKAIFYIVYTEDPIIDGDLFKIQGLESQFNEKVILRYRIRSEVEKYALQKQSFYGCLCKVSGTLKKPQTAKNPNGFDYRGYLAAKEIFWIIDLQQNPLQNCTPMKAIPSTKIKQLRYAGIKYLEKNFPPEIAGLSAALIFGDTHTLDPDLLSDYQRTGIVHLLAISGLHVSLFIGMIFLIGIRSGLTRQVMTNFLLGLLPVYVLMTGSSPSVVRSALMISLILVADKWKYQLQIKTIDALSAAFMLYIFISPLIIFDIGFQLSFLVSFAIILAAPKILKRYEGNGAKMIATSVTAQLSAMPLLLYHYFELSLIGIAANLLFIPLFSFVYLPGVYVLFVIQILFGSTPKILITLLQKIIELSNKLIGVLANLSFTNFIPGRPPNLIIILYILLIAAFFYAWERSPYKYSKIYLLVLGVTLISIQPCWKWINPYGEVTMIDVGQGDSLLIHLPHGQGNYLIDTGGSMNFLEEEWKRQAKPFEVGRDTVVPFLKGKGITVIDKLILTHGDMDHIGGAISILSALEVKQILMPSVTEMSETEQLIIKDAEKQGIPIIKVSSGDHWRQNESDFFILSPEKNFSGERNRGSIALVAEIGGLRWFFGGDLDQEGEERIIKKNPHLSVDVLKTGHHGSKTSSAEDFIKQIKPKVALISAGEHNRFGHPHQEVLERLEAAQTKIYRTDQQGAITYHFYRGKGTFSAYLP